MKVPPVAAEGTIEYVPTPAIAADPVLVSVTLPTVSLFCKPLVVNALVPKLKAVPYDLLWALAVIANTAAFTVSVPLV